MAAKLLAARGKGDRLPDILVYSADEFAASTDDGGNLLVSTRTLRELESEDELAALLAHELSHLALRHNERKSALRNFPVGVETAGWVAAAGDRMQGNTGGAARRSGSSLDAFGGDALSNTQVASLLWSDVLMPGWSRAQEREADLKKIETQISEEERAIGVLKAEWTHLSQPSKMQAMATRYLDLQPMKATQIAYLNDIPMRPEATMDDLAAIPFAKGGAAASAEPVYDESAPVPAPKPKSLGR